jgi:hypothetical protein
MRKYNEENCLIKTLKGSDVIVKKVRRSSFHVTQPLALRNVGS